MALGYRDRIRYRNSLGEVAGALLGGLPGLFIAQGVGDETSKQINKTVDNYADEYFKGQAAIAAQTAADETEQKNATQKAVLIKYGIYAGIGIVVIVGGIVVYKMLKK